MKVGVIGAGRIGGNAARLLAAAGHEVMLSFSRDEAKLARTAEQIGARAGAPGEAAEFGEVIVFRCPGRSSVRRLPKPGRCRAR